MAHAKCGVCATPRVLQLLQPLCHFWGQQNFSSGVETHGFKNLYTPNSHSAATSASACRQWSMLMVTAQQAVAGTVLGRLRPALRSSSKVQNWTSCARKGTAVCSCVSSAADPEGGRQVQKTDGAENIPSVCRPVTIAFLPWTCSTTLVTLTHKSGSRHLPQIRDVTAHTYQQLSCASLPPRHLCGNRWLIAGNH